jgi:hypothetical protein
MRREAADDVRISPLAPDLRQLAERVKPRQTPHQGMLRRIFRQS